MHFEEGSRRTAVPWQRAPPESLGWKLSLAPVLRRSQIPGTPSQYFRRDRSGTMSAREDLDDGRTSSDRRCCRGPPRLLCLKELGTRALLCWRTILWQQDRAANRG